MKRYPLLFIWLILLWGSLNNFINTNRSGQELSFEISGFSAVEKAILAEDTLLQPDSEKSLVIVYKSRQNIAGKIGLSEKQAADNPFDNVFEVFIEDAVNEQINYRLKYELFGVTATGVVRSVNDELAYGGHFVVVKNEWQSIEEALHAGQLKQGKNIVRFSIPDGANYRYTVRDITIVASDKRGEEDLTVYGPFLVGENVYIRGFVGKDCKEVKIDEEVLTTQAGAFEFVGASKSKKQLFKIEAINGIGKQTKVVKAMRHAEKADLHYSVLNNAVSKTVVAKKEEDWTLQLDGIKLTALKGSVDTDKAISVTTLRAMDMAPMGPGMINVTAYAAGYRLLPHDSKFLNNLQISLGIDSTKLPTGYSPKQVRTYFFDEATNKWTVLQKDTVQAERMFASAITDHFTDFINAIIKQPELPRSQAYTPTMFSDLKAANPLEGVNTISPPSANNNGTVNISLPIEVPAGRQGLQPQLALQYSSEGGLGILGLGWSLNIPAINVDTRWGVPRYFSWAETESYMMNGEELQWIDENDSVKPLFHRSDTIPRRNQGQQTTRRFIKRVEGSFQKITRHGTSPSSYWWEVQDKTGMTYFYGKYSNDVSFNPNCVLEKDGKLAYWALAEVRDLNGNFVRYFYNRDTFSGRQNDNSQGRQLYIDSIEYTGYGNTKGAYKVKFNYAGNDANEVQINARYGFKEVTAKHLVRLDVLYNNRVLRSYSMKYRSGHFEKRMLCFVLESFAKDKPTIDAVMNSSNASSLCAEGAVAHIDLPSGFKIHRFFYQIPYKEQEQIPFRQDSIVGSIFDISAESLIKELKQMRRNLSLLNLGSYGLAGLPFVGDDYFNSSSFLGSNQSFNYGGQGSLYIGLGPRTSKKTHKASISGSYSHNRGNNQVFISFQDINGDGYPDRVVSLSGQIFYQKLIYVNGSPTFDAPEPIFGLNTLGRSTSKTNGFGVQAAAGVSTNGSANLSFNYANTETTTAQYFADVNGDGFIDFVDNGEVLFNRDSLGFRVFRVAQDERVYIGGSCKYILHQGEVNDSIAITPLPPIDDELPDLRRVMMEHQPVRLWKAPFSGKIQINADIQLIEDETEARKQAKSPDGVTYTIQHNGTLLQKSEILANDYVRRPEQMNNVVVNAGDHLYFRLLPRNSRNWDDVYWSPEIVYTEYQGQPTDTNRVNADNKKAFVYRSAEDFWLYEKQQLDMPHTSNVRIHGTISSPPLSDTLFFKIVNHAGTTIYSSVYEASNGILSTIDIPSVSVNEEDSLYFFASTSSRIAYEKINFDLFVDYLSVPSYSNYDINSEFDRVRIRPMVQMEPLNRERFPAVRFIASNSSTHQIVPTASFSTGANGSFYLTVKELNRIVGKKLYTVANGVVSPQTGLAFSTTSGLAYYFDINTKDFSLTNSVNASSVEVSNGAVFSYPAGFYGVWQDTLAKFGPLYRGWGQFVYNKDTTALIDENVLVSFQYFSDTNNIEVVDEQTFANDTAATLALTPTQFLNTHEFVDKTAEAPFYTMIVDKEAEVFKGIGDLTTITATMLSNWRKDDGELGFHVENPVPVMIPGKKPMAPRKTSEQSSWTISASVGSTLASGGGAVTRTRDNSLVDYLDLNGDRLPDIVGPLYTQFSMPNGSLMPHVISMQIPGSDRFGLNEQRSNIIGLNLAGTFVNENKNKGGSKTPISQGGGASYSAVNTLYMHMDVNGDGLPDRVDNDGKVAISLGYAFEDFVQWDFEDLNKSSSVSANAGPSIQLEKNQNSWSIGAGMGAGTSFTNKMPLDVNGDGLVDFVNINSGEILMNTGSGFIQTSSDNVFGFTISNANFNVSANVGGTLGLFIPPFIKLGGSLSGSLNYGKSFERSQFVDINNDGFVDFISINPINGNLNIRYSDIAKFNLLERVESSTGQRIEISYRNIPSSEAMPQAKWVMDTVKVFDGFPGDGIDETITSFTYAGGVYDRYERVFMGYDSVITRQHRANLSVYRTIVEKYQVDDFLFKGLAFSKIIRDSIGRTFNENITIYKKNQISDGAQVIDSIAFCFGPYYPAVFQEENKFYEGGSQPITVKKEYLHGKYGNVVFYKNYGDIATTGDDLTAVIKYQQDQSSAYLVGLPDTIMVYNGSSLVRHRLATYNSQGKLTKIRANLGNTFAVSDFEYDLYGNIQKQILPPNDSNRRVEYVYTYDDTIHTYPVKVEDVYGHFSTTKYDLFLSKPLETTDMAGNQVKYQYNSIGKLYRIQGPKEIESNQPFTLQFQHWDEFDHRFPSDPQGTMVSLWAKTEHYDAFNTGNTISTVIFADAAGRVIQTKKKSVVDGNDKMIVSGREVYDDFGRAIARYYPSTESLGSETTFNPLGNTSVNPTRITYDVLDRPIKEIMPDNTETNTIYGFGLDENSVRRFKKTITDANSIAVSVLTDHRELQIRVEAPLSAITNFVYNPLGELLQSKDPEGNITAYTYDMAGRRTSRTHPDAGVTNWTYDNANNLTHMATANLAAMSQQVDYKYYYGQLLRIEYPQNPENNVYYEYGQSGNETGRISKLQDASGVHAYQYGDMGELVKKTSTGVVPTADGEAYSFATRWQYDSWNRIRSINYPDGEVVEYDYDNGGQLIHMQGTKSNVQTYVSNIEYDEFGSRTYFEYGNGVSSSYIYNTATRRLQTLTTTATNGSLHNITYTYDPVGNIISNSAGGADGLGGKFTYNY
ncbi:MAG: SpvB/TcaC N-terminal domain-containing protein, partial [Sphingobacteriaceae bacterium]|nr:SpvB/TcaC N-terminal domain-containing protein [Sphingobacteriaceae bacterium]